MQSSIFYGISTVAYIVAMMCYIAYAVSKNKSIGTAASAVTIGGFVSQTIAFLMRWSEFYDMTGMGIIRSVPLTNLYESLIFFVWSLMLGYIIVELKYKNRTFGAFVTPVAGLALAYIEMSGMDKGLQPLVPALQSNWLLVHVLMSFIAYATFAISFSTALMYLIITTSKRSESSYIFWTVMLGVFASVLLALGADFINVAAFGAEKDKVGSYVFGASYLNSSSFVSVLSYLLSALMVLFIWRFGHVFKRVLTSFNISADLLDDITYKSIAVGFPIFTLGGLIFGAIWADQAWGVYWSWDPKETWSLITWFVYAFYLHARLLRGWRGHKISVVAVFGFVAVVFTYLGVNLLLSGLHSYGSQ